MRWSDLEIRWIQSYGEQCWKAGYKHGVWGDKPAVNQQLTTDPFDEREAFEKWLSIKPCGAAHDFGWSRMASPSRPRSAQAVERHGSRRAAHADGYGAWQ